MRVLFLAAVLGAVNALDSGFPPLNTSTIAAIQVELIKFFQFPANGTYGAVCNPCKFGDTVGALVRLPFHDSLGGGRPNGKGGPNGCIDFTTNDNNGLQTIVATLQGVYSGSWSTLLSFADFIVLAGNTAILAATTTNTAPCCGLPTPAAPLLLPFRYGRVDDAACVGVDAAFLPSPLNSYAQTAANFVTRVGMTPRQMVAVLGAHTLGRCQAQNSGFEGGWTAFQSSFSNTFFTTLAGVQWSNKDSPTGSWTAPPSAGPITDPAVIMLKGSDVELMISPSDGCPVFDEMNLTTATPTPQPGVSCPVNNLNKATIIQYAADQAAWWADFAGAWQVMTEFTYAGQLQDPSLGDHGPRGVYDPVALLREHGVKAATA